MHWYALFHSVVRLVRLRSKRGVGLTKGPFIYYVTPPAPGASLITQPMLEGRTNCTELRSMDSYTYPNFM